jgi:hypothetical protein
MDIGVSRSTLYLSNGAHGSLRVTGAGTAWQQKSCAYKGYYMIEVERWKLSEKWDAVRYDLVPPRPWKQFNLNKMFGHPQYQIIQMEINETYRRKKAGT